MVDTGGANSFTLGSGNDTVTYVPFGNSSINGGTGTNSLIVNTSGNSTITPSSVTNGVGGMDSISNFNGNITAGTGNDSIVLNALGTRTIDGNSGTDTLNLTATLNGNITLNGTGLADGSNTLTPTSIEQLRLNTGAGNDTFNATAFTGNLLLTDTGGANSFTLGSGNDTVNYVPFGNSSINGGTGNNSVVMNTSGNSTITFGATTTVTNGTGTDTLSGFNTLQAGSGADSAIIATTGGADSSTAVNVNLGAGNNTVAFTDTARGFWSLVGTNGVGGRLNLYEISTGVTVDLTNTTTYQQVRSDLHILLSAFTDVWGTNQADSITIGAGVSAAGNQGSDTLTVSVDANIELVGSSGGDIFVNGGPRSGNYDNIENFRLVGGAGNNTLYSSLLNAGNVSLYGMGGADELNGNEDYARYMDGGDGNDTLDDGNIGGDTIYGGDGHDFVWSSGSAGQGGDSIDGGTGNDTLNNNGHTVCNILAGTGADTVIGGDGDDVVCGGSGNSSLNGGIGNDTIVGGASADIIYGGTGNDSILAGGGNDTVYGGTGGTGGDFIDGQGGSDTLFGGNDNRGNGTSDDVGSDTVVADNGDFVFGGNNNSNGGVGNDGNDVIEISGTATIGIFAVGGNSNDGGQCSSGKCNDGNDQFITTNTGGDTISNTMVGGNRNQNGAIGHDNATLGGDTIASQSGSVGPNDLYIGGNYNESGGSGSDNLAGGADHIDSDNDLFDTVYPDNFGNDSGANTVTGECTAIDVGDSINPAPASSC